MRMMCILLPHFPLRCEGSRRGNIKSGAIVTYSAGSQKLVLDYSPELAGLQQGKSLQEALARYGDAEIIQADISHYWSVFNKILDRLETKSPLVEGAELGSAFIGVEGLQLIYPDDNRLVSNIKEAIPEGFTVRVGIAENKFLAYLAAMHCPESGYRVLNSHVAAFLKDLSCDILPISTRSKRKLQEFGLHTLLQITALPPGPIQAQFGPEGKRIWELAGGYDDTPLYPRFMEETIEKSVTLLSVTVSMDAILAAADSLLTQIFARDSLKGRGIRSLVLWTRTWNSEHWEKTVRFKEPAMNGKDALSRIKVFLENYPQPGPVEEVGIKITGVGYGVGRQRSIFAELRAQDHLLEDIKQLELRLESPQVFRIKEVEPWSRIPERHFTMVPLSR